MGFQIRLWVGSLIFGFGIFSLTWFIRNIFKSRLRKPLFYRKFHPAVHIVWSAIYIALGLWIYPVTGTIPIIPLILGVAIGLYVSRSAKIDDYEGKAKPQEKTTPESLSAAIFVAMVNNEKDIEITLKYFSKIDVDTDKINLELKLLKVFSTIFLIETSVNNDKLRDEIFTAFFSFLFSKSSENYFGCPFESISEKFDTRLNKYHDAISSTPTYYLAMLWWV